MYYHVYIQGRDASGNRIKLFTYGFEAIILQNQLIEPYNNNKPLVFLGKKIFPSEIETIYIFKSTEHGEKTALPNGKLLGDEDDLDYVTEVFLKGKVPSITGEASATLLVPPNEDKIEIRRQFLPISGKNKIFIVHGREKEQALELQKYLKDILLQKAEMFEDVKKRFSSKTIIELLEYIVANTAYAFVVATPDDFGCYGKDIEKCERELLLGKKTVKAEDVTKLTTMLNRRARQNVVFEHGLFIGALGRDRVCCLLQEEVAEQESDIHGILYEGFKESVSEKFSDVESKLSDPKIGLIKK